MFINKVHQAFEEKHRKYAPNASKKRAASVEAHSRKTGVQPINFEIGNYVLAVKLSGRVGKSSP